MTVAIYGERAVERRNRGLGGMSSVRSRRGVARVHRGRHFVEVVRDKATAAYALKAPVPATDWHPHINAYRIARARTCNGRVDAAGRDDWRWREAWKWRWKLTTRCVGRTIDSRIRKRQGCEAGTGCLLAGSVRRRRRACCERWCGGPEKCACQSKHAEDSRKAKRNLLVEHRYISRHLMFLIFGQLMPRRTDRWPEMSDAVAGGGWSSIGTRVGSTGGVPSCTPIGGCLAHDVPSRLGKRYWMGFGNSAVLQQRIVCAPASTRRRNGAGTFGQSRVDQAS